MEFITCKAEDGRLSNMNISVSITDKFMQALKDRVPFELYTPYGGRRTLGQTC
jgi:ribonucleoside-diphosphate reductase alpha chain